MAHPRRGIPAATWIHPNAGAQFKQNPRGVVKKLYWVRTCETVDLAAHDATRIRRASNSPTLDAVARRCRSVPTVVGRRAGGRSKLPGIGLVEFFGVGAIGPLHAAVEFGGSWREHEEPNPPLLAGRLKCSGEFTAAIHLQGSNAKGHACDERVEEAGGGHGGRPV